MNYKPTNGYVFRIGLPMIYAESIDLVLGACEPGKAFCLIHADSMYKFSSDHSGWLVCVQSNYWPIWQAVFKHKLDVIPKEYLSAALLLKE